MPFSGVERVEDLKEQDKAEGAGIPTQFRDSIVFAPKNHWAQMYQLW